MGGQELDRVLTLQSLQGKSLQGTDCSVQSTGVGRGLRKTRGQVSVPGGSLQHHVASGWGQLPGSDGTSLPSSVFRDIMVGVSTVWKLVNTINQDFSPLRVPVVKHLSTCHWFPSSQHLISLFTG